LKRKVLFITGSSSGIGLATIKYFAEKGWNIAATMRDTSKAELFSSYENVRVYALDVTSPVMIEVVVKQVIRDFGKVDVVVNNAGYGAIGPFEFADDKDVEKQINTNFLSVSKITNSFIPHFIEKGDGVFINISSIAGRIALPFYSIYNASKFAIEGFSESLSYELHEFNIKVRIIEPGPIKTDFNSRSRVDLLKGNSNHYEKHFTKADGFYTNLFNSAISAEKVAKVIYKASNSTSKRMRYPVGFNAKALLILNKLLPSRLYRLIVRFLINL